MTQAEERFLTPEDLAERWKVPVATVTGMARRRKLPSIRLGRELRFREAAIAAWEAAQERASGVPQPRAEDPVPLSRTDMLRAGWDGVDRLRRP